MSSKINDEWDVLSFPAIATEDKTFIFDGAFGRRSFSRRAGETLHPEREPLATLEALRKTMGEYNFSSQYQQAPQPFGGNMIKTDWLGYYDELPAPFTLVMQSWDTANKSTELSDFSVCTTWGVHDQKFYLLHVYRDRLDYPDLKRAVLRLAEAYGPSKILIEDKASGTQLIQDLRADGVFGIAEFSPLPGTDKIMRLHAQTARFENGQVLLPREAPWLRDYVQELTGFPGSKYADQVDSTTQALHHLGEGADVLSTWLRAFA